MAKKSKVPRGSKAAFVRANPAVKALELVALGKKKGISLTVGHVYNIRASDKSKGQPVTPAPNKPNAASGRSTTPATELSRMDAQFRALVLRIGLYRAEQLFSELKASLSNVA